MTKPSRWTVLSPSGPRGGADRHALTITAVASQEVFEGYVTDINPVDRGPGAVDAVAVYSDADAAALYDLLNPWDPDRNPGDRFYRDLVMGADAVLDVGCGTGAMLHFARERGHRGRLVGLDPDDAALDRARRRGEIEWVDGTAADAPKGADFDLAVMTDHAFQCLVTNHDVRDSLAAIRGALRQGGRFAFETRHPQARAWEGWNRSNPDDVVELIDHGWSPLARLA